MKIKVTHIYDNYTGAFLATALFAGILLGGLVAYDPQLAAENAAEASAGTPTPTALPPTPVSINIPTGTPAAENPAGTQEASAGPADDFTAASALPNGWGWRAPEALFGQIRILADKTIVLPGESGAVYFLNPDGSPRGKIENQFNESEKHIEWSDFFFDDMTVLSITSERVFAVHPDLGLRWEFPVIVTSDEYWPQFYSGVDFWLVVDTANMLYALTPEEGLLWSYTLDGVPNNEFLSVAGGANGVFYASEAGGNLYAFNRDGVLWSFDPGENLRSATDPVVGPDGRIYYVVTSGTFGILVSIGQDGVEQWRTRLETFRFYQPPAFSAGGVYAYIDEDFVSMQTGQLASVEFPFNVDAVYPGEDGFDYLITGHHIIRWQIGPEGFEQLKDIVVNIENFGGFFTPFLHIHPDGLIEFNIFGESGAQLIWINSNTDAVETNLIPHSHILFQTQPGSAEYARCEADAETGNINCSKSIPGVADPIWSLAIDGIYSPTPGFLPVVNYTDGRLFVMPDPFKLFAFDLEIP